MLKWLTKIFKKKIKQEEIKPLENCSKCVWWKSEEENNMPILKREHLGYCDVHKTYTPSTYKCSAFKEERFEATHDSIQTEEIEINHDLSIERDDQNDKSDE